MIFDRLLRGFLLGIHYKGPYENYRIGKIA